MAALVAQVYGDRGWISEIGVLKSHRGRGIADALLRRSFATFAERGFGRVMLNVDAENPTGATALYERVGMRIIKRWDLWERSAGSSSPPLELATRMLTRCRTPTPLDASGGLYQG